MCSGTLFGGGKGTSSAPGVTPAATAAGGMLDPAAISARQRAARRMSDGLRGTYVTGTRGTEGAPAAGLAGPPSGDDGVPIIGSSDPLPGGAFEYDDVEGLVRDQMAKEAEAAQLASSRATAEAAGNFFSGSSPNSFLNIPGAGGDIIPPPPTDTRTLEQRIADELQRRRNAQLGF